MDKIVIDPVLIEQIKEELVMLSLTGSLNIYERGDSISAYRNRKSIFMIYVANRTHVILSNKKMSYFVRISENMDINARPYEIADPDNVLKIIKNQIKDIILQESII